METNNLIKRFLSKVKISQEGEISGDWFALDHLCLDLIDSFGFHKEYPLQYRLAAIRTSIWNCIKSNRPLCEEEIQIQIKNLCVEFHKIENKSYKIITKISLEGKESFWGIRLKTALNKKYYAPKSLRLGTFPFEKSVSDGFPYIIVSAIGKSADHAFRNAMDDINLKRSCFNLVYNTSSKSHELVAQPKPINRILIGPFYSVFSESDYKIVDTIWFDAEMHNKRGAIRTDNRYIESYNWAKRIYKKLSKKTKYYETVKDILISYNDARDLSDYSKSFLRLWMVLEKITGTSKDRFESTIKRASVSFKDREYVEHRLKIFKNFRNETVHQGKEIPDIQSATHSLAGIIEAMIVDLVFEYNFKNIDEYHEFLDVPRGENQLKNKLKYIKMALSSLRQRPNESLHRTIN